MLPAPGAYRCCSAVPVSASGNRFPAILTVSSLQSPVSCLPSPFCLRLRVRFRFPGFPVFITMYVAWTRGHSRRCLRLAQGALEARLVACVQVDGPVTSHYRGRAGSSRRGNTVWCSNSCRSSGRLETWIGAHHPYDIPSGLWRGGTRVGKYLSWARGTSTPAPRRNSNLRQLRMSQHNSCNPPKASP